MFWCLHNLKKIIIGSTAWVRHWLAKKGRRQKCSITCGIRRLLLRTFFLFVTKFCAEVANISQYPNVSSILEGIFTFMGGYSFKKLFYCPQWWWQDCASDINNISECRSLKQEIKKWLLEPQHLFDEQMKFLRELFLFMANFRNSYTVKNILLLIVFDVA